MELKNRIHLLALEENYLNSRPDDSFHLFDPAEKIAISLLLLNQLKDPQLFEI